MKYGLHGKLRATQGNGPKLAEILLQAAELVGKAEGCHLYVVSKDKQEPDAVWVTEVWDTKEAHDDSLKDKEVLALIGQAMPILDGRPEPGQVLDVLGGLGL